MDPEDRGAECIFQGRTLPNDRHCTSVRHRTDGVLLRYRRVLDGQREGKAERGDASCEREMNWRMEWFHGFQYWIFTAVKMFEFVARDLLLMWRVQSCKEESDL